MGMMNNVLVTGANGFVGKALCKKLVSEKWVVKGSVKTTLPISSPEPGVSFINVGQIGPDTDWCSALDGIDTVVHLATRWHLNQDITIDPIAAYRSVNVAGTEGLIRAAVHKKIRRFIYLSTVKVNGEGKQSPYTEEDKPAPVDPYGVSKYEAEQILYEIANGSGVETVIIRPPLAYGPGVKANFYNLLKLVHKGIPLPFLRVANRRSMIFLDNLIDAIITCIKHPYAAGQTYLVSDGDDLSTPNLISMTAEALGSTVRLFSVPPYLLRMAATIAGQSKKAKPLLNSLTVDTSKIRTELGWKPPFTPKEGLTQTARWFLNEHCPKSK